MSDQRSRGARAGTRAASGTGRRWTHKAKATSKLCARPVLGSDLPQMRVIGDGKECKAHLGVPHLYQEYVRTHGTVDLTDSDARRERRTACAKEDRN